jgi:hypothetical protein
MNGSTGPSRCDALQVAAMRILEQFRPMLDGSGNIKAVTLNLRIASDNVVRSSSLAPTFETYTVDRPSIAKFDFGT